MMKKSEVMILQRLTNIEAFAKSAENLVSDPYIGQIQQGFVNAINGEAGEKKFLNSLLEQIRKENTDVSARDDYTE